jgi:hypothetical protein
LAGGCSVLTSKVFIICLTIIRGTINIPKVKDFNE